MFTEKLDMAFAFARAAHNEQKRKKTDIPYITHPLEAAAILIKMCSDEDTVIAGLLHDTLEDAGVTEREIEEKFGENVLNIIKGCSEDKSLEWEDRKRHTIESLTSMSDSVKRVTLADKLSNIRSIADGYETDGEKFWGRFKRGKEEQKWYYTGLVKALDSFEGTDEYREFKRKVESVFGK